MPQLVGKECVICGRQIHSVLEAGFCESCGNPLHLRCLEAYQPADEASGSGRCSRCGGDPAAAPASGPVHAAFDPTYWGYGIAAAVILLIAVVAFLAWPGGEGGMKRQGEKETAQKENAGPEAGGSGVEGTRPVVEIETTLGTIRAELFPARAPKTVENFLDLVERGYYDGIIFHRVIEGFMIQTGDPTGSGSGGRTNKGLPEKFLPDEFHPELRHDKPGVLSMANSGPNTGDTQFFITTVPTPWLDDKHSVFGQVIEGMDVVRKIETVETNAEDRPLEEVKMVRVGVVEGEQGSDAR